MIKQLETTFSDIEELDDKRKELKKIRKAKIEGIIICSRAKWIDEGEKVSRYFCNLENWNFVNKYMVQLERENGSTVESTNDIVVEAKSFYEGLFSSRDHLMKDCDLDKLFSESDLCKLTKVEPDSLEGLVTYDEVLKCLKKA